MNDQPEKDENESSEPGTYIAVREDNAALATQRDRPISNSYIPVFDTNRFAHMFRIANVMAVAEMLPLSLTTYKDENDKTCLLPLEVVKARSFMIVNFSVNNNCDPFMAAQCASFIYNRLVWEGKFIAALIEQRLGIRLNYEWNDAIGDALGIMITGTYPGTEKVLPVKGTVGGWKTDKSGSPWKKDPRKMLAYRGAREWCKLYAPHIISGVICDDEVDFLIEQHKEMRLPPAPPGQTLLDKLSGGKAADNGFNHNHVARELGDRDDSAEADEAAVPADARGGPESPRSGENPASANSSQGESPATESHDEGGDAGGMGGSVERQTTTSGRDPEVPSKGGEVAAPHERKSGAGDDALNRADPAPGASAEKEPPRAAATDPAGGPEPPDPPPPPDDTFPADRPSRAISENPDDRRPAAGEAPTKPTAAAPAPVKATVISGSPRTPDDWRKVGAANFAKGLPRRVLPTELRGTGADVEPFLEAYMAGYDEAKAAAGK